MIRHRDGGLELARATDLIARGRNIEAIELLRRTLEAGPELDDARAALAALLVEQGLRRDALEVLVDGVAHAPARFAVAAAQLQAEFGDADGALASVVQVPAAARDSDYHALAAAIAQRAGRHDLAIAEYRQALHAARPRGIWWLGLGVSLEQVGQRRDALAAYRLAAQQTADPATRDFLDRRIGALASQIGPQPAAPPPRVAAQ